MKKIIITVLILILTAASAYFYFNARNNVTEEPQPQPEQNQQGQEQEQERPKTIRIVATGDMIPHDTVNLRASNSLAGYNSLLGDIEPILSAGDITICNQEAPSAGESFGISGYPSFNAPQSFAESLQQSGCNVISLGNNHIGDRGQQGAIETDKLWRKLDPLAVNGVKVAQPISYFEVDGVKFGFVSFTEYTNNAAVSQSINMMTEANVKQAFNTAEEVDFMIVAAHWGNEDPVVTQSQRRFAKLFNQLGADLVIGNGPHLVQEFEILESPQQKTHVYYSHGNALSSQLGIDQLTGILSITELTAGDSVEIADYGYLPIYMHYEWTASEEASEDLLARENLKLVPMADAADLLNKTRFNETVESRLQYVKNQLNFDGYLKLYSPREF